jgi:hypothetical protein
MSRRINTGPRISRRDGGVGATPAAVQADNVDDFLGRLVKYIPAELVGLYVAARGVIPKTGEPTVFWTVAAVAWIFVPVYFWLATTRNGQKPLKVQILLATIAFPIWVFAIGGDPVTSWPWYATHQYVASIVLMFATVAFGLIQPPPGA